MNVERKKSWATSVLTGSGMGRTPCSGCCPLPSARITCIHQPQQKQPVIEKLQHHLANSRLIPCVQLKSSLRSIISHISSATIFCSDWSLSGPVILCFNTFEHRSDFLYNRFSSSLMGSVWNMWAHFRDDTTPSARILNSGNSSLLLRIQKKKITISLSIAFTGF